MSDVVPRRDSCTAAISAQIVFQTETFSLWWGPSVKGICDEAVGFDAFHGFAGRLELSVTLEGGAGSDRNFDDVILPLNVLEQTFGFAFISDMSRPRA